MNSILAFWFAYVVTRPLGASFADWLGVSSARGGLGIGTGLVSFVLAAMIAMFVLALGRVALGVHFPTDVLAGAAVGAASALVLWWGPLRAKIDALADALGRRLDRVLDSGAGRLGLRWRA